MSVFATSHLLICPAPGVRFDESHARAFLELAEGCDEARSYVPSWSGRGLGGEAEVQVQFKGGPHGALAALWREHGDQLRCVWVRDSSECDGLDWIYRIDARQVEDDDLYNPCNRRAWYGFDELRVRLRQGQPVVAPPPWERLGDELRLRARGAYYADNCRRVFEHDGPAMDTPSTQAGAECQMVLEIPSVQCPALAPLLGEFEQGALRIEARYRGRLVRVCVRGEGEDDWPRWRFYSLDHWDNCLDQAFLLDQGRGGEALPDAVYALPHPGL